METKNEQPFIFISYSHKDSIVLKIIERLKNDGFNLWWDDGNLPGTDYHANIASKISQSHMVFTFLSKSYNESTYCQTESKYAWTQKKIIVPIYLEETHLSNGLDMLFAPLHALNYNSNSFYDELYQIPEINNLRIDNISYYIQRNHVLESQIDILENKNHQLVNRISILQSEKQELAETIESLNQENNREENLIKKRPYILDWLYMRFIYENLIYVIGIGILINLIAFTIVTSFDVSITTCISLHTIFTLSTLFLHRISCYIHKRNQWRTAVIKPIYYFIGYYIYLTVFYLIGGLIISSNSINLKISTLDIMSSTNYEAFCAVWLISFISSIVLGYIRSDN